MCMHVVCDRCVCKASAMVSPYTNRTVCVCHFRSRESVHRSESRRSVSREELKRQLSKQFSRQQSMKEAEEEEEAGGTLIQDEKAESGTVSQSAVMVIYCKPLRGQTIACWFIVLVGSYCVCVCACASGCMLEHMFVVCSCYCHCPPQLTIGQAQCVCHVHQGLHLLHLHAGAPVHLPLQRCLPRLQLLAGQLQQPERCRCQHH